MKRLFVSLLLAICLFQSNAWPGVQTTILKGEAVNDKSARIYVMIFDEEGRPVKGLDKENFLLKVEGEPVTGITVEPVSATESPLSVVLGVDVSGSMNGRPFTETQRSISRFLDQLDRKDYISLMIFGTEVSFLTDFTSKKYEVRERMRGLSAVQKWTHLYDATFSALDRVQKSAPTTKKAVVLITDGKDEQSTRGRAEALDKASKTRAPIFVIGFGHEIDKSYLEELCAVSGGYFLSTPDPDEISLLYDQVLNILKNEYVLTFDFSGNPGNYTANLVLKYQDVEVETYREFLFNPAGAPVIIKERVPEEKPVETSWFSRLSIEWIVLPAAALVLLILIIFLIRSRKSDRKLATLSQEVSQKGAGQCRLVVPDKNDSTHAAFMESMAGGGDAVDATRFVEIPDTYLEVDCLAERIVPLLYQGVHMLEELIVARKSADGREKEHWKKGCAYLLVLTGKQVVSRPKEGRYGHARIFLTGDKEYTVEDLGSKMGTFVNDRSIKSGDPVTLKDGDVIEFGGKSGIRVQFKKTETGGREEEIEPPPAADPVQ